ncbi:MAG: TetR/AcrR family transcriptional regulator [Oscillospiraceae bacterium]
MSDNTTRRKILDTMFHLVAEKGYDKASIGQLAERIGLQKASIYYYFKSKEDIFLQLAQELYGDSYRAQLVFLDGEPDVASYEAALLEAGRQLIDSYFEHPDSRRFYAEIDLQTTRIPALKELVRLSDAEFYAFLEQCLARGVALGAFPATFDLRRSTQLLYTVLIGIDQAILYDLPLDPKAVWADVIANLLASKERAYPQL